MRMIAILIAWFSFGSVVLADVRFERANADYRDGRFAEAAVTYGELLGELGPKVSLLQNQGSAHFQAGDFPRAILSFERALKLEPRNPDLRANLKLAQDEAAVFSAGAETGWERLAARLSKHEWSRVAVFGSLLLPLVAVAWVAMKGRRRWGLPVVAVADVVAVGIALAALEARSDEDDLGIVLASRASVRISPFASAEVSGSLSGGREVRLGPEENGFRWVRIEGGPTEGWVAEGEVEGIDPATDS